MVTLRPTETGKPIEHEPKGVLPDDLRDIGKRFKDMFIDLSAETYMRYESFSVRVVARIPD